ncbi:3-hydroxyacyl-CoA dehydrogenase NAD-binding domain-containing protein [Klebsiella variicola subsp. variicola]|nr:3-hydroxyacyl-CoA dehydrogenase NAD-binding domain-containing protein [Klebsiella variicola subsp. variicola]
MIGSGTMGAGIAEVAAAAGHPVLIYDIDHQAIARAIDGIARRLASRVERGKLASEQADALLARLHPAHDLAALADADLVIEAASERLEVKTALVRAAGCAICAPSTLLTSNTSSIFDYRHRRRGQKPGAGSRAALFNPAPVMKLVEVVSGLERSAEVVRAAVPVRKRLGKQPVRRRSTPGFIVSTASRVRSTLRRLARAGRTGCRP